MEDLAVTRLEACWPATRAGGSLGRLSYWSWSKLVQYFFFVPQTRDSLSQGDHAWHTDVLEAIGGWEGEVGDGPLIPLTYCDGNAICKKLVLDPNMTKVQQALNIPSQFCEWRWLLSEHRKEVSGLPSVEDVERWKLHGSDLSDLPVEQEKSLTKFPEEKKASSRSTRDEAVVSRSRDTSPQ
ncbi:cyclic dof factor 2 [Prunus yedoensis var. nudiflora]|uniref:Cyclic dof factor 2 n=1 Tax=Prunus yedoensis var. nudiflora TaxID=2094558 RepID=A0A314ZEZ1_PRUYE|nr:cyclic dof factor 2 [Prunus yedoensis var. nudiflora]